MEVFATFNIYNSTGHRVAEGHKASFCLEDNQCLDDVKPRYACANFGDQGENKNNALSIKYFDEIEINYGETDEQTNINSNVQIVFFLFFRYYSELLRYLSIQHRLSMG